MSYVPYIFSLFFPCRMILYECCPGYMKLDGKRGCPAGLYSFIPSIGILHSVSFLIMSLLSEWLLASCYMIVKPKKHDLRCQSCL